MAIIGIVMRLGCWGLWARRLVSLFMSVGFLVWCLVCVVFGRCFYRVSLIMWRRKRSAALVGLLFSRAVMLVFVMGYYGCYVNGFL